MSSNLVVLFATNFFKGIDKHFLKELDVLKQQEPFKSKNFIVELATTIVEFDAKVSEADIIFADPFIVTNLSKATNLKWLNCPFAGVDRFFSTGAISSRKNDYILTRTCGVYGILLAEYVLAQIIMREHSFIQFHNQQLNCQWSKIQFRPLHALVIGILGLGDIGISIAKCAKTFGSTIWGLKKSIVKDEDNYRNCVDKIFYFDQLKQFMAGVDYLINVLPSTPNTRGLLIGNKAFEACKPGTVFINVGRGDITDETTILDAIHSGQIAGAILDVFSIEPLPATNALWKEPKVVITPHNAGTEDLKPVLAVFLKNFSAFVKGEKLDYVIDWNTQY